MDLDQIWQSTLGEMEIQLSRANFATWLKDSKLVDKRDGTLYVALPNNFAKEWVENKYHKNILGVIRNLDGSVKKIEFVVGNKVPAPSRSESAAQIGQKAEAMDLDFKTDPDTGLNPRYTLSSFVVGPSNELAV